MSSLINPVEYLKTLSSKRDLKQIEKKNEEIIRTINKLIKENIENKDEYYGFIELVDDIDFKDSTVYSDILEKKWLIYQCCDTYYLDNYRQYNTYIIIFDKGLIDDIKKIECDIQDKYERMVEYDADEANIDVGDSIINDNTLMFLTEYLPRIYKFKYEANMYISTNHKKGYITIYN